MIPTAVLLGAVVATGTGLAGASTPRVAQTLWVAPKAVTKGEAAACKTAKYHSIGSAIKAAANGDTVTVCAGTYSGSTTISTPSKMQPKVTTVADIDKSISLIGQPGATINATGIDNGVTFYLASSAKVEGFTISGALGEGVLAIVSSKVTIENNVVEHNDNGGNKSGWFECVGQGAVPGDCGEGIHLMSSADSQVLDNSWSSTLAASCSATTWVSRLMATP